MQVRRSTAFAFVSLGLITAILAIMRPADQRPGLAISSPSVDPCPSVNR